MDVLVAIPVPNLAQKVEVDVETLGPGTVIVPGTTILGLEAVALRITVLPLVLVLAHGHFLAPVLVLALHAIRDNATTGREKIEGDKNRIHSQPIRSKGC